MRCGGRPGITTTRSVRSLPNKIVEKEAEHLARRDSTQTPDWKAQTSGYPTLASEEPICVRGMRLRNVSKCAGGGLQRLQSQELMPTPGMKLLSVLGPAHPILPGLVIQRLVRERASCVLSHQSSACRSLFQRVSTLRQDDASIQSSCEFAVISRRACGCLPVARATLSSDLA